MSDGVELLNTRDAPCEKFTVRKYVPRRLQEGNNGDNKEEEFLRKIKGTFNKLCTANVETQIPQILEVIQEIKTQDLPSSCWISLSKQILQRAIAEPNFHQTYATLCCKIATQSPGVLVLSFEGSENLKFGDLFPLAYESELEQRIHVKDADDELISRMREKMLCATKFIGEIGKRVSIFTSPSNLLPPIALLLSFLDEPSFQGDFTGIPSLCVECACTLLNLIGKTLDMSPDANTEKVFEKIQRLGQNKSLVPRLRFMALDLYELRGNKWLPRILTKKTEDNNDNKSNTEKSNPSTSSTSSCGSSSSSSSPSPSLSHKEKDPPADVDLSSEDAELINALETLAQKLKGKSETCVATAMKKFVRTMMTSEHAKVLAGVVQETPDLAPARSEKIFLRRSSTQMNKAPLSPQPLSRNFHSIINLIKLNSSKTQDEEMNQSLITKISTLKASELIEVVGSIFRKMCEMPEEYPYCLNICLTLANSKTCTHTFQETLETCCQDESALKMFNAQAALNTYLQLVSDLEREMNMDVQVVKKIIGNVQNGLYELTESEASILSELESLISFSTSPPTPSPPDSPTISPATNPIPTPIYTNYKSSPISIPSKVASSSISSSPPSSSLLLSLSSSPLPPSPLRVSCSPSPFTTYSLTPIISAQQLQDEFDAVPSREEVEMENEREERERKDKRRTLETKSEGSGNRARSSDSWSIC